jgi:hypothetical protein
VWWSDRERCNHSSLSLSLPPTQPGTVGAFYFPKKQQTELTQAFARETRARFLEYQLEQLPSEEELEVLWSQLGFNRINFLQFKKTRDEVSAKCKDMFTAELFMKFPQVCVCV